MPKILYGPVSPATEYARKYRAQKSNDAVCELSRRISLREQQTLFFANCLFRLNRKSYLGAESAKAWAKNNPEKRKEILARFKSRHGGKWRNRTEYHRIRSYGLDAESYQKLAERQGYCCAICKQKVKLFVDHDHTTGKVRGLLCRGCNTVLGLIKDNPLCALEAARYLKENSLC